MTDNDKEYSEYLQKYQAMGDHDIIVETAIIQKFIEQHLKTLNASVAKNQEVIDGNSKACDRRYTKIMVILAIGITSGILGSNAGSIRNFCGL